MAKKNAPSKEHLQYLKQVLAKEGIDLQCEISLCLSDIPKSYMQKAKNNKIYCDIVIGIRKEPDQWGRDLKVYMKPTAKDKENNVAKSYVGGGRMITFALSNGEEPTESDIEKLFNPPATNEKDDLPF